MCTQKSYRKALALSSPVLLEGQHQLYHRSQRSTEGHIFAQFQPIVHSPSSSSGVRLLVIINLLRAQRLQPPPVLGGPHVLLQRIGRNAVFAASTTYVRASISKSGGSAWEQTTRRLGMRKPAGHAVVLAKSWQVRIGFCLLRENLVDEIWPQLTGTYVVPTALIGPLFQARLPVILVFAVLPAVANLAPATPRSHAVRSWLAASLRRLLRGGL